MSEWIPGPASPNFEAEMEILAVPEEVRVDFRRFIEFLRWRKEARRGNKQPMSPEMRDWLTGADIHRSVKGDIDDL